MLYKRKELRRVHIILNKEKSIQDIDEFYSIVDRVDTATFFLKSMCVI